MPELQNALSKGGFGESGYDMVHLVGVEVRRDEEIEAMFEGRAENSGETGQ